MAYVAFISYKHSALSRPHAEALEAALRRYSKPIWKPPIAIFRDERVLRPGDDLPAAIRSALTQSEYLIFLASREAAESPWVRQELETWCQELGRGARLLIVHIADRISADAATGEVVWAETDALPLTLQPHLKSIPVWADLSWATTAAQRDLNNVEFKKVVNAIIAVFRNKTPGDMNDEQVLTHRRNMLFRNVGIGAVIAFALAAILFGLQAWRDRLAAVESARAATESEQKAVASAQQANAAQKLAEKRRGEAEASAAAEAEQRRIAERNQQIAEVNAARADLRGRAAQALAALPGEPPAALRRSVAAVRDSARRLAEVPPDLQFSLASGLIEAREARRAPIRVLPTSMALAPDGSTLAIGSLDLVMLYTPAGVLRQKPLAADDAGALHANAVAFSPDGRMLVTASGLRQENCVLRIWTVDGRLLAGPLTGHHAPVRAVAFSPDSRTLASGAEDGSLRLWRTDGTLLWSNDRAYQGSINALVFAPNGKEIVGAGGTPPPPSSIGERTTENGMAIWSTVDGAQRTVRRTDATVYALDLADDVVVSGGADGTLRIWEWFELRPKAAGKGHSGAIRSVKVDPLARVIATGGDDGRVGLWNMSGQLVAPLQTGHTGPVRGVAVLPAQEAVVSVAEDATLRWWSLADPVVSRARADGIPDAVLLETLRGSGLTISAGQVARVDPGGSPAALGRIELPPDENVQALAYSSTGAVAIVLGTPDWSVRVVLGRIDAAAREIVRASLMPMSVLLFSPGGEQLFVGGGLPGFEGMSAAELSAIGTTVEISNAFWLFARDGRLTAGPIRLGQATPTAATFFRDGRQLIVGDSAGDVHFLDQQGRVVRRSLHTASGESDSPARAVTALAVSGDGRMLAVATGAAISVRSAVALGLWDLGTRRLVATLPGHAERINALAFNPEGDVLASAGGELTFVPGRSDYAIRLWSSPSGHALSPPWVGHEERVVGLSFIDGGARLASIDAGGTLHHWRTGWREWARAAEDRGTLLRRAAEVDVLRLQGERMEAAGGYRRALDAYTRAMAIQSQDPELLWSRARMLRQLGRLSEALKAQTAAIDLSPFDAVRVFERGKLRLRMRDSRGAVADFTAALELAPFIIRPAPVIAEQLPWNHQAHDAAAGWSKIAVADVRLHRAIARLQIGDVEGADVDVTEAYALGLRTSDFYLTRAWLKRARGDDKGALEDERLAEQARSAAKSGK